MKIKDFLKNLWIAKLPNTMKPIIALLAIPLLWYIGINLLSGSNLYTFAMIFIIVCLSAFILFILKKAPAKAEKLKEFVWDGEKQPGLKYYIATIIIMLLFPVGGLALNASMSYMNGPVSKGLFGDFSHPFYYLIAAVNSLLLMIPPRRDVRLRLLLFFLKAAGFTYILYFFIVFLPVLPLGALGLFFCGLGIFIFAPAIAAVWQSIHMFREWRALAGAWGHIRLTAVFLIGMLTLPLCLTSVLWGDKANFHTAVRYLDQANPEDIADVNTIRLNRTLQDLMGDLQPSRGIMDFSASNTPILSELYSRLVMDGKVVSQETVLELENLFFDAGHNLGASQLSEDDFVNRDVRLTAADSDTVFDEELGAYRTKVDLTLRNRQDIGNSEYVTSFHLPDGAYISDYYLEVAGVRKAGILADRRAAEFLYKKIVRASKDPGLLRYIGENTLELRVYPFGPKQQRKTGFEIIHYEPFDLDLDDRTLEVGKAGEGSHDKASASPAEGTDAGKAHKTDEALVFDGGILLPSAAKEKLEPAGIRNPRYFFILDNSKNSDIKWLVSQVDAYTRKNNITEAEVLFTNYKTWFHTLDDMYDADYNENYGYNLNLAMQMVFRRVNAEDSFPVIIAVSDNMPAAIFPRDIYPLSGQFPESQSYYALNHNLTLTPYSFQDNKAGSTVKEPIIERVLDYKGNLVADNGKSELILNGEAPELSSYTGNLYKDALMLDAMQKHALVKGGADTLDLVRASFRSRILAPQTAFIVVETEAQEKELLNIQEQILNNTFDPSLVMLYEPPLWLLILLIAAMFLVSKRKQLHGRAGIGIAAAAILAITILFPLTSCSSKTKDNEHHILEIEEEIGLDIPDGSSIEYEEDYGWFGDGEAFAKVEFPAGTVIDLDGILQSSGLWKRLPVPIIISLRIFGGEYNEKHYSYGNDNMRPAQKLQDGIYYFRDRSEVREAEKPFLERSSYHFTFALYDNQKNNLYFFKYDS